MVHRFQKENNIEQDIDIEHGLLFCAKLVELNQMMKFWGKDFIRLEYEPNY